MQTTCRTTGKLRRKGKHQVVEALSAAEAKVDLTTSGGASALFAAAQEGHLGIVEALIDATADVSLRTNSGKTPLMAAMCGVEGHSWRGLSSQRGRRRLGGRERNLRTRPGRSEEKPEIR